MNIINDEFNEISNYFLDKDHEIDKQRGFVGRQILSNGDLFLYQYYRDIHFIYWGLQGNWNNFDPTDKVYYENLKRIIEDIYNGKK